MQSRDLKEYFNAGHKIEENMVFEGSTPYKGLYPHWMIKDGKIPKVLNDSEKTFKQACIEMQGLPSDVAKINAIHLLVSQLVNIPYTKVNVQGSDRLYYGGAYEHVQESEQNAHHVVSKYRNLQSQNGLATNLNTVQNLDQVSNAIMPISVNIKHRFADCRGTNALFAWGLSLAGLENVKWLYVNTFTYTEGIQNNPTKGFNEDHALLVWKVKNSHFQNEYYVLDSYNSEFHGIKLSDLISKNGVTYETPYHSYKEQYKKIEPKVSDEQKIKEEYKLRSKAGTLFFFPRILNASKHPKLKCFHSKDKATGVGSEEWGGPDDTYTNVITTKNNYPTIKKI